MRITEVWEVDPQPILVNEVYDEQPEVNDAREREREMRVYEMDERQ
jgi:hypothetical protein